MTAKGKKGRSGSREPRGYVLARRLAKAVAEAGGRVYYVGGCVRDSLMGRKSSDVDVEVHGVTPQALEEILTALGGYGQVGKAFGIYSLQGQLDVAMPRMETATGRGHRDFQVFVDPYLGPEKSARRRDLTVNALMEDVLTGQVLDFFGGQEDLKAGILRHVDGQTFGDDPLRVLRVAQFAARLGFAVAPETVVLCRTMDLTALAGERIWGEVEKALRQAPRPSVFFETLRQMDQLSVWFPEVEALSGVPQSPIHHPEGDVWTHTMLVLDLAARLARGPVPAAADSSEDKAVDGPAGGSEDRATGGVSSGSEDAAAGGFEDRAAGCLVASPADGLGGSTQGGSEGRPADMAAAAGRWEPPAQPVSFLLAALCHDLGKAVTTSRGRDGRIHAIGHEKAGVTLAHQMLDRLRTGKKIERYVENMITLHMQPNMMAAEGARLRSTHRLFDKSVDPAGLLLLARADKLDGEGFCEEFLWERLDAYRQRMAQPHVTSGDLKAAGIPPGPVYGKALSYAKKLHLSGVDKDDALKQTLAYIRPRQKKSGG